jgi:3-oxoacyl-[acyl-carrier protein] reductase
MGIKMDLKLNNAVAIVAGASSGLGFHTACRLLEEGARVVACSRSLDKLKEAFKSYNTEKLLLIAADITKLTDIKSVVASTIERFQQIDLLVTNGGGPPIKSFEQLNLEMWDEAYHLILRSCIGLIHESLPYLKNSNNPSILAIASITAKVYVPGLILSNVLRPSIVGLVKALSFELGQYNIRVNALLPGSTLTSRLDDIIKSSSIEKQTSYEIIMDKITVDIPLGRIGTPEEFANVAAFILSPMAGFINGVALPVDGGFMKTN